MSTSTEQARLHRRTDLLSHLSNKCLIVATLKLLVSVGLLVWIVSRANLADIIESLSQANLAWLVLAACSPAVGMAITATRWEGLLRTQGVKAPLPRLMQSCVIANFVRQFLPSTIGGDAIRAYDSWKIGASKSVAVTTLVVDRIMGLFALVLFAVAALFFAHELTLAFPALYVAVLVAAVAMVAIIFFVIVPSPKLTAFLRSSISRLPTAVQSKLEHTLQAITAYQGRTHQLARAFLLSLILQVNVVTFYYLLGRSMGFTVPYSMFFLIVPIAVLVMLIPISVNGIGIREGIFVLLFSAFAVNTSDAVALAWLEHGLILFYGLIGGVVFALRKNLARPKVATAQPPSPPHLSRCLDVAREDDGASSVRVG